ncbi:4-hydroxyphenylpyruvate dioxygenase-like protein [Amphibalanus amphitrite]|uniref:4-hydroxyphenylpyruvate dioxygenase-like protein n=1 Tax=Amphibalanus amphitrite TaxID=1232801 RepID=A0A6A4V6M0_AMPAM|nr:4-hydroxyphenylpyruvate dioxygenase-like protein [Amphibalanus amphitrite]
MASLHHVELCTANAGRLLRLFTGGYGFQRLGGRVHTTLSSSGWSGQAPSTTPDSQPASRGPSSAIPAADTSATPSFNVALLVRDVAATVSRAARAGGPRAAAYPYTWRTRTVPLSTAVESEYVDHVTLTCRRGESTGLLDWYQHVFGMRRFQLNSQDSPTDGVVMGGEVGMALKAMEYWRCAETGLQAPPTDPNQPTLKFVVAESLHDDSHVETFNRQHGSPGVQHIGLHTDDIVSRVAGMASRGVNFRRPPPAYYTQTGKGAEIAAAGIAGEELSRFRQLGLLLDSEADSDTDTGDRRVAGDRVPRPDPCLTSASHMRGWYLMQIFSEPLFEEDTFFMEVLERRGARGFGQGNITALARSIIEDQRQRQESAGGEPGKEDCGRRAETG